MSATNESENLYLNKEKVGYATVSFPDQNKPQVFSLAGTELAKSNTSVNLFWSYPVDVMTLIIETPFTEKKRSYAVRINKESLEPAISNVYQILKNQEIEVGKTNYDLVLDSDCNYQVIIKFQVPPDTTYYGANIRYDVIPK